MVTKDEKENKMRTELFARLKLSKENEKIAEVYLDMERQEDPKLLANVKPQAFQRELWHDGNKDYLEWLRKKKRTEELGRYLRFLAEVGGSTVWAVLIHDNMGRNNMGRIEDLEKMLVFLKGEQEEEMKMAIRARLCCQALCCGHPEEMGVLCEMGKENPEIFLRAMDYCRDESTLSIAVGRGLTRQLLAAAYLHWKEPGTAAPGVAEALAENLVNAYGGWLGEMGHVLRRFEIESIQNFARTAGKDSPFPQNIISLYRKVAKGLTLNTAIFAACAFLALEHSMRFEILFRLAVAANLENDGIWKHISLKTAMGIVDEECFGKRMDEIEDMLPMTDEDYILWCLQAGYDRGVRRMAQRCPEGMNEAIEKSDSDEFRKLAVLLREANPALYEEMPVAYEEMFREKIAGELVKQVTQGKDEMRRYLLGECPVKDIIPGMNGWGYSIYLFPELYERIARLPEEGEYPLYRRAVVLEALKGGNGFLEKYWVLADGTNRKANNGAGAVHGTDDEDKEDGQVGSDGSKILARRQIRALLRVLDQEELPVWLRIVALGGLCDNTMYDKKSKTLFMENCTAVLKECVAGDKETWEAGMIEALQKGGVSACCLCLMILSGDGGQDVEKFKEALLACAENGTEQIHTLLLNICRGHREWEEDILALLQSKKLKARTFAVLVLEEWSAVACLEERETAAFPKGGNPAAYLGEVKAALAKEKNKKLAAQLQALAEDLEKSDAEGGQGEQPGSDEDRLAAMTLKGARKRKVEWVQDMALPVVHRQDGTVVSQEYMLAILAVYADMETPGISRDGGKMAEVLDAGELAAYMSALYEGWLKAGAEAKKRWVLYAAAIHGGTEIVPVLYNQIKEWAEHSRGAIASDAVRALALNGGSEALILVDQMSRKFKFRQIRNAAGEALSHAAAALGISREELEDNLVTDMGFDGQMERIFDYGPRKFTVRLTSALELEVYDGNGKRLKNLPSPGKQDDPEKAKQEADAYKQLKKQLKTVAASQKIRLEQALSMARFWHPEKWKGLFVKNPVMHQFAVGLIWGVYVDGTLKDTFRYMEDGSFNTVDGNEFAFPELPDSEIAAKGRDVPGDIISEGTVQVSAVSEGVVQVSAVSEGAMQAGSVTKEISGAGEPAGEACGKIQIGLAHPLELSETELGAWKEQLSDYEITQPFAQLERPVYRIEEEEKEEIAIARFEDKTINGLSLSGKLLAQGWFRGEVLDAGFFYNYYRNDGKFGAELAFSGSSVGYENEEVTVHHLYFYRFDGSAGRGFGEENRCRLSEVPPRYFSEVLLQIAGAVEPRTREG